ncbi:MULTISPECIES: HlyD family efflux transporter periplasmic adaptor subunit [Rhizobium]|uniref:PilZ domain-containing protein n=1 Tax=Rhizobium favelukesii TaxID=348824 RepID=W6RMT7_9HYPH|nr:MULTISPECIES: HlyD family efflux transporter periplasmic adaptor subunit [Rhizobium]MCA0804788.1 HlyD family efflux transporter periplasmic adaptor subunit [Rhizobium sp. T1473]MCS0458371.1 HlyD family efflux transporter periplasmic adaptor subunit [Rhizobium favelukesii]UFS79830.1 HlyD family efflux transporter periplasmic adaptor subunit [Rhizobium sp. T136]CDM61540.1 PilZ domain-containing protein [Rhizobium favelukesii]
MNVVKFEADVQRQHARYKLPLKCVIDGYRYTCLDWSVGGVGVATGKTVLPEFKTFPVDLEFPFDGFVFTLRVDAQVRYCDPTKGRTGFQYMSLTEEKLRFLRYVRDAHLSGEVVTLNDVLDLSSRSIDPRGRKKDGSSEEHAAGGWYEAVARRWLRIVVTSILGIGVLLFLWGALYQRLWTFRADQSLVTIDSATVIAPSDGVVTNIVTQGAVKAGDPVATILPTANNRSVTVLARCDCIIQDVQVGLDSQVRAGQRLLSLSMQNAKPHVVAMVDYSQALRLYKGARVLVELPDGKSISNAAIRDLPKLTSTDLASGNKIPINIDVGDADLASIVGTPVTVRFVHSPWTTRTPPQILKSFVDTTGTESRPAAETKG